MNATLKAQIVHVRRQGHAGEPSQPRALNMALWLIINSPDYSVQK